MQLLVRGATTFHGGDGRTGRSGQDERKTREGGEGWLREGQGNRKGVAVEVDLCLAVILFLLRSKLDNKVLVFSPCCIQRVFIS